MGTPRPDAYVLPYLALRITFTTEQACEGAPAGPRRGLDCLQQTHGGRGEGRFVPLDPGKRQPLTRVRSLRVTERDWYKRHPDASRLRLVCGGNVCVGESRMVGILAKHRRAAGGECGRRLGGQTTSAGVYTRIANLEDCHERTDLSPSDCPDRHLSTSARNIERRGGLRPTVCRWNEHGADACRSET